MLFVLSGSMTTSVPWIWGFWVSCGVLDNFKNFINGF